MCRNAHRFTKPYGCTPQASPWPPLKALWRLFQESFNINKDGNSLTSVSNPFYCLTNLTVKKKKKKTFLPSYHLISCLSGVDISANWTGFLATDKLSILWHYKNGTVVLGERIIQRYVFNLLGLNLSNQI